MKASSLCVKIALMRTGLSVTLPQSLWQELLEIVAVLRASAFFLQQHADLLRQQAILLDEVRDCATSGEKETNAKRHASQMATRLRPQRTLNATAGIPYSEDNTAESCYRGSS